MARFWKKAVLAVAVSSATLAGCGTLQETTQGNTVGVQIKTGFGYQRSDGVARQTHHQ